MYLTTGISIMLVLILVGSGCLLLLSADHLIRQVKQNMTIEVVLSEKADSTAIGVLGKQLDEAAFAHSNRFISKEDALQEHIQLLGEDPTKFLGYNPLRASYEINLEETYANRDSIVTIQTFFESFDQVDQVVFPERLVIQLSRYVDKAMWVIAAAVLLLLIVCWALITNMIRLQLYSKRFLINTMTLVGATSWCVRKPFVKKCVGIGMVAACFAFALLAAAVYMLRYRWGVILFPYTPQRIILVAVVLMGLAVLITLFASLRATGRYIRMKESTLYEI